MTSASPVPVLPSFLAMLRELGLWRALRVGLAVDRGTKRGEPFLELPPPDCEKERLSRAQIGPAILLYRALEAEAGRAQAMKSTEVIAAAGAVAFLKRTIGELRRPALLAMRPEEREAFVRRQGAQFFNATIRWDLITPDEVRFTVERCRFPRLCEAAGTPELAPVFCKGDATFFGETVPHVTMERAQTIAEGGDCCPFVLKLG
jgi:hypothetical protein